ncbi:Bone morphogenetic protein 3 [Lamellibrachia satsuma]|nr:Bone morphogenetic protein 3 [Lamellibrachia satsuma]
MCYNDNGTRTPRYHGTAKRPNILTSRKHLAPSPIFNSFRRLRLAFEDYKLRPSNHATIQSLVQAVGLYTDVPAPCCVPEALSSVTLLYFDESQNVVLKNYPAMTVQSCACR